MDVLLERLDGAVLLTPNNRLARNFLLRYAELQRARGVYAWSSAPIYSWSAWLQKQFASYDTDAPLLMSPEQEAALWRQCIAQAVDDVVGVNRHSLADFARDAYVLCRAWRAPWATLSEFPAEEARLFVHAADAFCQFCMDEGWVSSADLPDWLAMRWRTKGLGEPPLRLCLTGFDECTPQQQAVLNALTAAGGRVEICDASYEVGAVQRCVLADEATEARTVASWARQWLTRHRQARIGIVVVGIEHRHAQLRRIFHEVLTADQGLRPTDETHPQFNLSYSAGLLERPLVAAALRWLQWFCAPLPPAEVSTLLRSPFVAAGRAEELPRACLDLRLRDRPWLEMPMDEVLQLAQATVPRDPHVHCPALCQAWSQLLSLRETWRGTSVGARQWSERFATVLRVAGWPGDFTLSSAEFQAYTAFFEVLQACAQIDAVIDTTRDASAALSDLRRALAARTFQPESRPAPIQILGPLEAAGEQFDAVWLMGAAADQWPPAPQPNPLLPVSWQRQHGLPRSSAQRESAYAETLTHRLLGSGTHIWVSHARWQGDVERAPSPLITAFEQVPPPVEAEDFRRAWRGSTVLERWIDRAGAVSDGRFQGGASLLQSQAQCPFQAFARYRLGLRSPAPYRAGLTAAERGNAVHQLMLKLWGRLRSQAELLLLDTAALQTLLQPLAREVALATQQQSGQRWGERYLAVETDRLAQLALDWLEFDRQRPPFTIAHLEWQQTAELEGLQLRLRVDRVDRLADGSVAVIDYKTGRITTAEWFGERLAAPQLPLYAVVCGEVVSAVLYASLKPGNLGYSGVDAPDGALQEWTALKRDGTLAEFPDWTAVQQYWQSQLRMLAREFLAGRADVQPLHGATTCRNCGLQALCRIGDRAEAGPDDAAE